MWKAHFKNINNSCFKVHKFVKFFGISIISEFWMNWCDSLLFWWISKFLKVTEYFVTTSKYPKFNPFHSKKIFTNRVSLMIPPLNTLWYLKTYKFELQSICISRKEIHSGPPFWCCSFMVKILWNLSQSIDTQLFWIESHLMIFYYNFALWWP